MLYFHGITKSELGRIYKEGKLMQYSVAKPKRLRHVWPCYRCRRDLKHVNIYGVSTQTRHICVMVDVCDRLFWKEFWRF